MHSSTEVIPYTIKDQYITVYHNSYRSATCTFLRDVHMRNSLALRGEEGLVVGSSWGVGCVCHWLLLVGGSGRGKLG